MHFYELLANTEINAKDEVIRFERLLNKPCDIGLCLRDVFNKNILKLPATIRRNCSSIDEMFETCMVDSWSISKKRIDKLVLYIEILLTILKSLKKDANGLRPLPDYVKMILANAEYVADILNCEIKECKETVIIVPRKDELILAEKSLAKRTPELALDVWRYEHRSMNGNLDQKRLILQELGSAVEPYLKNMNSSLRDNVGFLLNNLNIRHNNVNGSKANSFAKSLNASDLEGWYDRTFELLLQTIIVKNHEPVMKEVDSLRKSFKNKNGEV